MKTPLGERQKKPIQRLKFKALTNLFTISGEKVLVMKPVTYMNLSGEAVRPAADFYKIPPERILVVSDDTALPPRLRVGVGEKPHPDYDMADWVLGRFTGEDRARMDQAVERAADAIECILKEGLDRGMSRFNGQ